MAIVKARRVTGQEITFPGTAGLSKDEFDQLKNWGRKLPSGAKKYFDKALNFLKKKQVSPTKSYDPGEAGIVEQEDQTLRVQSIISNVNRFKTLIKATGELVNNIQEDQRTLFKEYSRVRELIKELQPFLNTQNGKIGITPESDRIINTLEDAYSNITVLITRLQDSVDAQYDKISDVEVSGARRLPTMKMVDKG